jgi:hypothetical protein
MSQVLVNKTDLDAYLSTLDMTNPDIKRVIAALNTIDTSILNTIMYYLVYGQLEINSLYTMPISNESMKLLITSVENGQNTLVSKYTYYRNKIKAFPTWIQFEKDQMANAGLRITRRSVSAIRFCTQIIFDTLNIIPGSYYDVNIVRTNYMALVNGSVAQTLLAAAKNNISEIKASFNLDISPLMNALTTATNNSYFVYSNEGTIPIKGGFDTINGYIYRKSFLDVIYENYVDNITSFTKEMATDYANDTTKDGTFTINRLMADPNYSWQSIFNQALIANEADFINAFRKVVFLRYVLFTKIYGSAFFDSKLIATEVSTYNALINFFTNYQLFQANVQSQTATQFATTS